MEFNINNPTDRNSVIGKTNSLSNRYKSLNKLSKTKREEALMRIQVESAALKGMIVSDLPPKGSKVQPKHTVTDYTKELDALVHQTTARLAMMPIDDQLQDLSTRMRRVKTQPNTKATRQEMKTLMKELEKVTQECLDTVSDLDRRRTPSHTMQVACMRLNQCKELSEDAALTMFLLKKEKHEEAAKPIKKAKGMEGKTFEALFKAGNESAVVAYLKMGREGEVYLTEASGSAKNPETVLFERAFESLMLDFDRTEVLFETKKMVDMDTGKEKEVEFMIFTTPSNERIVFTHESFKKVDFSKVTVSNRQLDQYEKMLIADKSLKYLPQISSKNKTTPTQADFQKRETDYGVDGSKLTFPDKLAINVYTGSGYKLINFFMKGDLNLAAKLTKMPKNAAAKEALIHSVFCTNALHKLDDHSQEGKSYLWRGEGEGFKQYGELDKCKEAVDAGGMTTRAMGFISSAYEKPSTGFYKSNSPAAVLIKNISGKKVTPWSQYREKEREVLLPPTYIKWEHYKEVKVNNREVTFFIARPVSVDPTKPIKKDLRIKSAKTIHKAKQKKKSSWWPF